MRPRPVWRRHRLRTLSNVNDLPPPTEEEKFDAIQILADPMNQVIPGLWDEASRIFYEASVMSRGEALRELTRLSESMPGGYR